MTQDLQSAAWSEQVGTVVAGQYKLLERIGEGGMGQVWFADQLKPLKRGVALKLIKPGMDSRSVLGRFDAERQALAVMDHPKNRRFEPLVRFDRYRQDRCDESDDGCNGCRSGRSDRQRRPLTNRVESDGWEPLVHRGGRR